MEYAHWGCDPYGQRYCRSWRRYKPHDHGFQWQRYLISGVLNVPAYFLGWRGHSPLSLSRPQAGTGVVTFSSIAGSFTSLRIMDAGRSTFAGSVAAAVLMTFNSDTGTNYANQLIISNGSSTSSFQATGQIFVEVGEVPESSAVANYPGQFIIDIPLYAGTTFAKSCQAAYLRFASTTVASLGNIQVMGVWNNTGAITRIDLTLSAGNWVSGSTVSLYGIS